MRNRLLSLAALSMMSGVTFGQSASVDERFPRSSSGSVRFKPYVDKAGLHHGHSGDKLARKVLTGTVGLRGQLGAASGWIVKALKVLDTLDPEDTTEAEELDKLIKVGEVLALATLANSKAPEFECLGEPSLCTNPRGCACQETKP